MDDLIERLNAVGGRASHSMADIPTMLAAIREAAAELERLQTAMGELRASFRANMLRHVPSATHEEITRIMDKVAGPDPENARLTAENAALQRLADDRYRVQSEQQAELQKTLSECAALRADAGRYRWLREHSDAVGVVADNATEQLNEAMWAQEMDEYIDENRHS